MTDQLYLDNWAIRRKVMFASLFFCAGNVQYLLIWGNDTALNRDIASTLAWSAVGIIGAYIFGASWDDMDKRRQIARMETAYLGAPDYRGGRDGEMEGA